MRSLSRVSTYLVLTCFGLLTMSGGFVWTQEAKLNPRVKQLQQQRLEVLQKMHDASVSLFKQGRVEYEAIHSCSKEYFEARCEYAETREERMKAIDEAIQEAESWIDIAKVKKQLGRGTEATVYKAQADLLELQIEKEKIE